MKLAWHIIAKDLRRHQLPYGLWLCLLFAKQGALALGFSDWSADAEWFDRLQMGSMVLSVVEGAVAFLLVGSWVMEDPLVGSTQFWVTRPIAGRRLLAAKLLGVVLGFVVVPLLIAMTGWIVCGLSGLELGRQFVWSGTLQLALVAAAFVLAAVSDRGNRFLVVLLGSVVVLVALGPVVAKLFTVYPETRALALTRATVGSCLIVAAVITAVWLQFTRRNVLLGAACLLSGVVAGVSACNQFPVELFGGWQTTPRELPEARNVELVLSHMQPTQPPSSVKIPQGQRWIQVVCTVRNLPEHLRLRVTSFGRFSFIAADGRRHDVERSFLAATIPDNDTYDARAAAGIRPYVFDDDAETKAEIGQRIEERQQLRRQEILKGVAEGRYNERWAEAQLRDIESRRLPRSVPEPNLIANLMVPEWVTTQLATGGMRVEVLADVRFSRLRFRGEIPLEPSKTVRGDGVRARVVALMDMAVVGNLSDWAGGTAGFDVTVVAAHAITEQRLCFYLINREIGYVGALTSEGKRPDLTGFGLSYTRVGQRLPRVSRQKKWTLAPGIEQGLGIAVLTDEGVGMVRRGAQAERAVWLSK